MDDRKLMNKVVVPGFLNTIFGNVTGIPKISEALHRYKSNPENTILCPE
jgi:hypothetical protein